MALRVALYAEGPTELADAGTLAPSPGSALEEEFLGPAHVLIRRCLVDTGGPQVSEVRFEAPLRTGRGRMPRGSDLLDRMTLSMLLTWPLPAKRPDLAVVLVDADGDRRRLSRLRRVTRSANLPAVVAVAVQEFEAWLIADHAIACSVLQRSPSPPRAPESMNPGEANELLARWIGGSAVAAEARVVRRRLAEQCTLELVRRKCRAFQRLFRDLRAALT